MVHGHDFESFCSPTCTVEAEVDFKNENGMNLKNPKKLIPAEQTSMIINSNNNTNNTNHSINLNQSEFMEKIDKIIRIESRERKMNATNYSRK